MLGFAQVSGFGESQVAIRTGALDQALSAAVAKEEVDRTRGEERGAAFAVSLRADVLMERGEVEEALRIRQEEELPVYERLARRPDVLMCRAQIGLILLRRDSLGDREEASRLLHLALAAAEEMRNPVAELIRRILHKRGLAAPSSPSLPGQASE